jgi:hypothetical protein
VSVATMLVPKRFILVDIDADRVVERDVNLQAFYLVNEITVVERREIEGMKIGADFYFGGGAANTYSLRREA